MIDMICHCGEPYQTHLGNLERGCGLSCGKPCAGSRRRLKTSPAKRADGVDIVMDKKPLNKRKPKTVRNSYHMRKVL